RTVVLAAVFLRRNLAAAARFVFDQSAVASGVRGAALAASTAVGGGHLLAAVEADQGDDAAGREALPNGGAASSRVHRLGPITARHHRRCLNGAHEHNRGKEAFHEDLSVRTNCC